MGDDITLDEVKAFAGELSPWAHIATVGSDGEPDVVPVHPAWGPALGDRGEDGDVLWAMVGRESVKARNVAENPNVALHWQVTEVGDGVEVWGTAELFTDTDAKRALWDGVFDYDLRLFAEGGPEDSPGTAFLAIYPSKALAIHQYGAGGMQRWHAG